MLFCSAASAAAVALAGERRDELKFGSKALLTLTRLDGVMPILDKLAAASARLVLRGAYTMIWKTASLGCAAAAWVAVTVTELVVT